MPCPQGIDTDCFLCHREIYPSQMDRPHGACAKPVSDWARLPQSLPLRPSLSCLHWHTRHLHTLSYISCQAFHWPVLPALKTVSYHYFHLLHRCLLLTHVFHLLLSGRYTLHACLVSPVLYAILIHCVELRFFFFLYLLHYG